MVISSSGYPSQNAQVPRSYSGFCLFGPVPQPVPEFWSGPAISDQFTPRRSNPFEFPCKCYRINRSITGTRDWYPANLYLSRAGIYPLFACISMPGPVVFRVDHERCPAAPGTSPTEIILSSYTIRISFVSWIYCFSTEWTFLCHFSSDKCSFLILWSLHGHCTCMCAIILSTMRGVTHSPANRSVPSGDRSAPRGMNGPLSSVHDSRRSLPYPGHPTGDLFPRPGSPRRA